MRPIVRSVFGVIAGLVAGNLIIFSIEMMGPPAGGVTNAQPLPASTLLRVLLAWMIGALAGAWVASRISLGRSLIHAAIVGGVFLLLAVVNMTMIPHPLWFWACAVFAIPAASYLGARLATPRPSAKAAAHSAAANP